MPHCRPHDLRHTLGTRLRRTMSNEGVASAMGISGAIACPYFDHEAADLTRRAFAKIGTNAARSDGGAASESNETDVSFAITASWAASSVGRASAF